MEELNAKAFLNDFLKIFTDKRDAAIMNYYSNRNYTSFIIQEINEIISSYHLITQNEYFRIDAIGWAPRADAIERPTGVHLSSHLWDLEIAVEHENDQHDWMDEVVKLAHIVCPLRVVIGYLPWARRKDDSFDMLNLEHINKYLKKLACYDNMLHGEFLIILGNCNTAEKPSRYFGYKGYVYNKEEQRFSLLAI